MTRTIWSETAGRGRPLVLIHGWGMNASVWDDMWPILSEDFRVTRLDLPGHGRSRAFRLGGLDELSRAMLDVVPDDALLLGWSLGGLAATRFAASNPHRVRRLLLVSSSPCFVRRDDWSVGLEPEVFASFEQGLADDYEGTLKRFLGLQLKGVADARELIRVLRGRLSAWPPEPQSLALGLRLLEESDLRAELKGLEMPVAVMLGGRDTLVPIATAEALQSECGIGGIEIVQGAAHIPFLSHQERFLDWIKTHR